MSSRQKKKTQLEILAKLKSEGNAKQAIKKMAKWHSKILSVRKHAQIDDTQKHI